MTPSTLWVPETGRGSYGNSYYNIALLARKLRVCSQQQIWFFVRDYTTLMRLAYRPIEKGAIVLFILIDTSFAGRFERPCEQE